MKKVLLVNVAERDIWCSRFNTKRDAYEDMKESLCQAMHWNEDDFIENMENGDGYEYGLTETTGYANADDGDMNWDWLIIEVEKPFILVSVIDREISITEFDTLEEAQDQMLEAVKECPDWEDWEEDYVFDEETDEFGVHKTSAWANADDGDMDCDWVIIEVEKLEVTANE